MKANLKIIIDGIERVIKSETLSVRRGLKEYSASFSIIMEAGEIDTLHFGMDVQIFKIVGEGVEQKEVKIYGGLINSIDYKLLVGSAKTKTEVEIECFEYNILMNRFFLTGEVNTEPTSSDPNLDKNTAGLLAKKYVQSLLSGDGVKIGRIDGGAKLADTDIDELYMESLREILDKLTEYSGAFYQWKIDFNKNFHFYKDKLNPIIHSDPKFLIRKNSYFRDISYRQDLSEYRNVQYIIGGEASENLPDENLSPDGKLKLRVEMPEEILKMKTLNGGSGIWENVYDNNGITTIAVAEQMARDLLAEFSETPAELNFTMDYDWFKEEDNVFVSLPEFGLNNANFTISEVEINDLGAGILEYRYTATQRSGNKTKTDFGGFLKDVTDLAKNPPIPKDPKPSDPGLLRDGLISWIDPSDTSTITTMNGRVLSIIDKQGMGYYVAQPYSEYQPTVASIFGKSVINFDGKQYMAFQNTIPNARTVFVVYQDLTNESNKHETSFMDGVFPGGVEFAGGGAWDNNVFNSVAINRIYKSWVNTIEMSPSSVVRPGSEYVILAFTLSEDMAVSKLFSSGKISDTFGTTGALRGTLVEFMVYNRPLQDSEIDSVNKYLMNKHFK